jgi:transcriptional regulator with XRE-family HTH domain
VRPADLTSGPDDRPRSLLQLRVAAGLRQGQLAAAAGLTRTKYSALERGEIATIRDQDLTALATALGVHIDEVRTAHAVSRHNFTGR